MSNCCFCNFIKRSFLYQILIIIAALKLKDAYKYNRAFIERIGDFLDSINLPEEWVDYLPRNKEITHKGFLISLIVFASFSILNISFFKFLSGIGCLLLGFLYHNPIPQIKKFLKKQEPCSWATFEQNLPEMEFILYVCLALAMFANAFCSGTCKKEQIKEKKEENVINLNKVEDKKEQQVKTKKEKKENNKQNKEKGAGKKNPKKKKE